MPCNAIGTLCNSICGKCSVGKICDCSKNQIIVIGQITPEAKKALEGALEGEENLQRALHLVHTRSDPRLRRFETFRVPADKCADKQKEICFGIIDVASRSLELLSKAVRLDKREGWSRLKAAAAISGIDLEDKYGSKEAITEKQAEVLVKQVKKISRLASPAAFLWKKLKDNHAESEGMLKGLKKTEEITKEQFKILKTFDLSAALKKDCFAELDPKTQALFFQAAEKYPSKYISKFVPPLVEWTLPDIEEEEAKSDPKTPSTGSDERRIDRLMEEIRLENSPETSPQESSVDPDQESL